MKGDFPTEEVLNTDIAFKREKELDVLRLRPHADKFVMCRPYQPNAVALSRDQETYDV